MGSREAKKPAKQDTNTLLVAVSGPAWALCPRFLESLDWWETEKPSASLFSLQLWKPLWVTHAGE